MLSNYCDKLRLLKQSVSNYMADINSGSSQILVTASSIVRK